MRIKSAWSAWRRRTSNSTNKYIKMNKVSELAKMIDHSILHPTMTDVDLRRECEVALKYDVASVCVKPYMVKQANGDYNFKGATIPVLELMKKSVARKLS
jgi:hypothetical protein